MRIGERRGEALLGYLLVGPDVLGILIFVVVPIGMSLVLSFTDWTALSPPSFVGLQNYAGLFRDPKWLTSMRVTTTYVALIMPLVTVMSLGLAIFLQTFPPRWSGLLRTAYFAPYMLPLIVVSVVWKLCFDPLQGFWNYLLRMLELPPLSWLGSTKTALLCIVIVNLWWLSGYYMILFIAGLNDIPKDYYDAASIDGASAIQTFRYVTLPLLRPTLTFVLVMLAIESFQLFDMVYVMTQGGPARSTMVNVYYIYQRAFQFFDYGYSSAMAFVLFVIVFSISLVVLRLMRTGRVD